VTRRRIQPVDAVTRHSAPTICLPRDAVAELSGAELRLLAAIVAASDTDGRCLADFAQLAGDLGYKSRGSISEQMTGLYDHGYIRRDSLGRIHLTWVHDVTRVSAAHLARLDRAVESLRGRAAQPARESRAACAGQPRKSPHYVGGQGEAPDDGAPPPCVTGCGRAAQPDRTVCTECTPQLPAEYIALRDAQRTVTAPNTDPWKGFYAP